MTDLAMRLASTIILVICGWLLWVGLLDTPWTLVLSIPLVMFAVVTFVGFWSDKGERKQ